jgi:cytochrome c oxidase subunit 4
MVSVMSLMMESRSEVEREERALAHAGWPRYLLVLAALVALTVITFGLSYVDTGAWSGAIALLIATGKASLVVLFFMHLREQRGAARAYLLLSLGFVLLLLGGVLADGLTRFRPALPAGDEALPPTSEGDGS